MVSGGVMVNNLATKHNFPKNKEKLVKKKLGSVAMLVMVLALGVLFAACENGVQEVEGNVGINYSKANPVASVTAREETLTLASSSTKYSYVFLSWDAVDNVSNYQVVYQQEGKKTVQSTGGSGGGGGSGGSLSPISGYAFDSAAFSSQSPIKDIQDIDKYIAYAMFRSVSPNGSGGIMTNNYGNFLQGKKYRFGVRTSPLVSGSESTQSDIVWSEYVQF
jgi:hypothetical protein